MQAFIQPAPKSDQIQEKYQGLAFSGLWGEVTPTHVVRLTQACEFPATCPWLVDCLGPL